MNKLMCSVVVGLAVGSVSSAYWVGTPIFDHKLVTNVSLSSFDGYGGPDTTYVHWADFNQDGYMDILTEGTPQGNADEHLVIYLNAGGEELVQVLAISEYDICGGVADWRAVDFNGDGFPDLVNASCYPGPAVILNNLGPNYACSTDLDKDGATAIGDLLFVIDRWGECPSG